VSARKKRGLTQARPYKANRVLLTPKENYLKFPMVEDVVGIAAFT
jgi:hypothetical protein